MNDLVHEWLTKAEADLATAQRELGVVQRPNYDAVCFHAQQAAEKFLKALLQHEGVAFPKTHDLPALAKLTTTYPSDSGSRASLERLTDFAVSFRYPGEWATRADAALALDIAAEVRQRCLTAVGPDATSTDS